jgi:hypothetical protein
MSSTKISDSNLSWRNPNTNTKGFGAFMKKKVKVEPKVLPEGPWKPFTDWQPGLVCGLCKTTIRKAISPYTVNCCNDVYCADCIYKYHVTDNNKTCINCKECFEFIHNVIVSCAGIPINVTGLCGGFSRNQDYDDDSDDDYEERYAAWKLDYQLETGW